MNALSFAVIDLLSFWSGLRLADADYMLVALVAVPGLIALYIGLKILTGSTGEL